MLRLQADVLDCLLDHTGLAGAAALRATCHAMAAHRPDRFRRLRQCASPRGFWVARMVRQPADVLQWAYALRLPLRSLCPDARCRSAPWPWLCWEAAAGKQSAALEWAAASGLLQQSTAACDGAAANGDVPLLAWLRARHAPAGPSSLLAAARGKHLQALEWLLRDGGVAWCPTVAAEMAAAARTCDVVLWAARRGLEIDRHRCALGAAGAARWDVVRALKEEHGMRFHSELRGLYHRACEQGRGRELEWLWGEGCPGDDDPQLPDIAAAAGRVGVLRWLIQANGRLEPQHVIDLIHSALSHEHAEVAEFLAEMHHS